MFQRIISFSLGLIFITTCGSDKTLQSSSTSFTMPDNPTFHSAIFEDIDGDKVLDIITSVEYMNVVDYEDYEIEKGDYLIWFRGDPQSPTKFESEYNKIGPNISGIFMMYDIDNDGDNDIAGASFYSVPPKSFGWYERKGTAASPEWEYHKINSSLGGGIQLEIIKGLYSGSDDAYAVGTNHTNTLKKPGDPESGVFLFKVPEDPKKTWGNPVMISSGIVAGSDMDGVLAPGAFDYGDLDNDGDIDLVVSGDGDPRIFYYEQESTGEFTQYVLEPDQPQTGLMKITDLNGDGDNDIIMPCYENNTLFLYKGNMTTGADSAGNYRYDRITLDDAAGSGPAFITVDDLNGDSKPDIIVSLYGLSMTSGAAMKDWFKSGVVIYEQGDNLDTWTKITVQEQDGTVVFATRTDTEDIDGDGDKDILLPTGFFPCAFFNKAPCGAILWYENPGSPTGTWTMHEVWRADH